MTTDVWAISRYAEIHGAASVTPNDDIGLVATGAVIPDEIIVRLLKHLCLQTSQNQFIDTKAFACLL